MRYDASSVLVQTLVFFAANPDEALETGDIAMKAGVTPAQARNGMESLVKCGLVNIDRATFGGSDHKQSMYTPGPELLRLIGRKL